MAKKYKIQFLPLAIQDITEITDYIADDLSAPQAAYELLAKIDKAVEPLEQFPYAFPAYKDAAFKKLGYRIRPVANYLIFYVVVADTVEIRRVIYAMRNLPELLEPEAEALRLALIEGESSGNTDYALDKLVKELDKQ